MQGNEIVHGKWMKLMAFLFMLSLCSGTASGSDILLQEEFVNMDRWKEVFFPKIPLHTRYAVGTDGKMTFVRAESRSSASLLVYKHTFNPYEYPTVSWKWKIDNVMPKADIKTRQGDDLPIRVYIAFAYDPAKAGFLERILYNALKLIYGEYPPRNSLNYVWSSLVYPEKILPSPYTKKNMMVLLEQGDENIGRWVREEVNVLADYRRVFGEDPPAKATIGIMSDTDNTGGEAVSYITSIRISR